MFQTLLAQISTLIVVGVSLWGGVRGRWPERATGLALLIDWFGSQLGEDRRIGHHGQPVMMTLDVLLLTFSLVLTASCRRTWLLWMSACLLLAVLTHIAVGLDPQFTQWSYLTANYLWTLGVVLSYGIGIAVEGRRPVEWLVRLA